MNTLVHGGDRWSVTLAEARSHLCQFLSNLPREWRAICLCPTIPTFESCCFSRVVHRQSCRPGKVGNAVPAEDVQP